jgi:hypothetical protein
MSASDISRSATDFRKHYQSVRMQMGRPLAEDDFNEFARIVGEDLRRSRVHTIGPAGSPDSGLHITNPTVTPQGLDFDIGAGTFYLGGMRLEIEHPESYHAQSDWPRAEVIPVPSAQSRERLDLVYVEAFAQTVRPEEDNELFEVALGGVDTSTRIRTIRRVRVQPEVKSTNCPDAWTSFVSTWKNKGEWQQECEFVPDVKLKVGFAADGTKEDLCSPPVVGGYLGAENHTIRVQLVDEDHFTWGYDNATPLYRVSVGGPDSNQRRTVTLSDDPKDQAHWPRAGQVVELLRSDCVLPNGERLAETTGSLAKVAESYDPDQKTFTVEGAALNVSPAPPWTYLRVWDRGADTSSEPAIAFTPDQEEELTGTGLTITVIGTEFRAGDHWTIAARPASPNSVVPWEFTTEGRPPHGYRRFYAPLAIIRWYYDGRGVQGEVTSDCRRPFRPLTEVGTGACCTFRVGDGFSTHGDFDSIQEAIDHLPDEGGEICLLAGMHRGCVRIIGRRDIVLVGNGEASRLEQRSGEPEDGVNAVVWVTASSNIRIESLSIESRRGAGVLIGGEPVRQAAPGPGAPGSSMSPVRRGASSAPRHLDSAIGTTAPGSSGRSGRAEWLRSVFGGHRNLIGFGVPRPMDTAGGAAEPRGASDSPGDASSGITSEMYRPAAVTPPATPYQPTAIERLTPSTPRIITLSHLHVVATAAPAIDVRNGFGITIKDCLVEMRGGSGRWPPTIHLTRASMLRIERNVVTLLAQTRSRAAGDTRGQTAALGGVQIGARCADALLSENLIQGGIGNGITLGSLMSAEAEKDGSDDPTSSGWGPLDLCAHREPGSSEIGKSEPEWVNAGPLGHIYIMRNRIQDMGLNGIGVVCFFTQTREMIHVQGLTIEGNEILGCLWRSLAKIPASSMNRIGYGGIALADVTRLVVRGNVIEANGTSHVEPICGLFLLHGEGVEISGNSIANNGTRTGEPVASANIGPRGGIYIVAATATEAPLPEGQSGHSVAATAPVLALHDNVVSTPLGHALFAFVVGPVSVRGNHFMTQGPGPAHRSALTPTGLAAISTVCLMALQASGTGDDASFSPFANLLFCHNQCTLSVPRRESGEIQASICIFGSNDIVFQANQCDCLPGGITVSRHVVLLGGCVRTSGNRLAEPAPANLYSAVTYGSVMNSATDNHAVHCVITLRAPGKPLVVNRGNLVLMDPHGKNCKAVEEALSRNLSEEPIHV